MHLSLLSTAPELHAAQASYVELHEAEEEVEGPLLDETVNCPSIFILQPEGSLRLFFEFSNIILDICSKNGFI